MQKDTQSKQGANDLLIIRVQTFKLSRIDIQTIPSLDAQFRF